MGSIFATIAAAFAANDAPQGPAWLACETIDKGGYHVFADPTCVGRDTGSEYAINPATGGLIALN